MNSLANKNILFFSQYFFGYEKKIANKMTELGATVSLYDEMSVKSAMERALLKVSSDIFRKKTERYYKDILDREKKTPFDIILFIDCEMPTECVLREYREAFPNARMCLHMWDSIENLKGVENKFKYFDHITTFDRKDAKEKRLIFRPLFFCDEYRAKEREGIFQYDFSFIGTIHSDRYRILSKLMQMSDSFFVYPYLQSRFIYYLYKIIKPEFRRTSLSDFKFEKLDSKRIAEIVNTSKAVIDIQHPRQTGLTMRTLEMLGMKKKFITTNKDIENYDFYDENNICIIDRKNPIIPDVFLQSGYREVSEEVYEYYSIERWIVDVLGVSNG